MGVRQMTGIMTVSVVVCTYNRREWLERCLAGVQALDPPPAGLPPVGQFTPEHIAQPAAPAAFTDQIKSTISGHSGLLR